MAGAASVLEDSSTLSRLDRILFRFETMLALISGVAIFALMLLAVWSVGGRHFFNAPVSGYVDWIIVAMPFIAITGIAYTQRLGGHVRMDMVVGKLRGRALWAAEFITTLVVLILFLLLVWGSWAHFDRSFDMTKPMWSRDSTMDINLPLWPAKLVVPFAFVVLCARLVLQLWGFGRAFVLNLAAPVAVPLIQSVEQIAAEEADTLSGRESR